MDDNTLLDYSVSTHPIPLAVSSEGRVSIVVSYRGGNSGQPATDYVDLTSIVFDFGVRGSDAADLTTVDGTSLHHIVPPAGWPDPDRSGLRFTFTPPLNGGRLFPHNGLLFDFKQIPVNDQQGSVVLAITETAASPGDPSQPSTYPPLPLQARLAGKLIGKFPADFSVGDLVATPPNVSAGAPLSLAWLGTPEATYTLSYEAVTIVAHADGTKLAANDFFPDASHGDTPFALDHGTTFTLTVIYTPPGGSNPVTVQRQVTVGVNYPGPVIDALTLVPEWFDISQPALLDVELAWRTRNGAGDAPVVFTLNPPLSDSEVNTNAGNEFFVSSHIAGGAARFKFTQAHRVELNVTGQPGTKSVQRSIRASATQPAGQIGTDIFNVWKIVASRDGRYVFVANQPPAPTLPAISVIIPNAVLDPAAWTVTGLCPGFTCIDFALSARGRCALAATTAGLLALEVDWQSPPERWNVTHFPSAEFFGCVAISPDESYGLVARANGVWVIHIGQQPASGGWQFTRINYLPLTHAVFSPDNRYAFATGVGGITVIAVDPGVSPAAWKVTTIVPGQADNLAVSPDGRYIIYCSGGALGAIAIDASQPPATWKGFYVTGITPVPEITFSPDGRCICLAPNENPLDVKMIQMLPNVDPSTWPVHNVAQMFPSSSLPPAIAITPHGMILLPISSAALQCFQITPAGPV